MELLNEIITRSRKTKGMLYDADIDLIVRSVLGTKCKKYIELGSYLGLSATLVSNYLS